MVLATYNTHLILGERRLLMCPTVSKKPQLSQARDCCPRSCHTGLRELEGSEIKTTHFGAMPKTVNPPGKKLEGSVVSLMDLLGKKYGFDYTTVPSKTPNRLIANVSWHKKVFQSHWGYHLKVYP